jgi:integrase/recombinase XerD
MIYVMGEARRPRQMALSPKACKALIRYEKVRERHINARSSFYWLSHKHERFTQSGIQQMVARRVRQAGIGHVRPHQFRHTYATSFLDNGGTESALMRQSGWRSRKVMERYTRPPPTPAPTAKRANSTSATASSIPHPSDRTEFLCHR